MGRTNLWYKVDVRLSDKFEVLHIAKRLGISSNECVGSLLKLWSISLTDFPEGQEAFEWILVCHNRTPPNNYAVG